MFEYNGIKIRWYGHDTFTLERSVIICIDPYKLSKSIHADIVLISHNHFDHMSLDDLKKILSKNTTIVAAKECIDQLVKIPSKEKIGLSPGQEKIINDIKIKAIPAYNIDKINPDTHKPFHPKEDNKIGFVISIGETSIYHTGDSDLIPEMNDLKPDILLVPVSGTYVMSAQEAARAVEKIKPKVAIPMHYGTIVGSENDAKEFRNMVKSCEVQILTKE
ncbi:MAG TPA: MBL fold metallo-hydrolase [Nitrosopumilaceae archaeon]|nr:MBL fold metallo-hydrolase [Nitrosopumilaceae archaeon]